MKIGDYDVLFKDRAMYIRDIDTLVLSDLHLGRNVQIQPFPKAEHTYIEERIRDIIDEFNPSTIILNGDVINQGNYMESDVDTIEFINEQVDNLILTLGNHEMLQDGYPPEIEKKYNVERQVKIDDILFHHGHRTPTEKADLHIIGHTHPTDSDNPVAMYGEESYYGADIVILPSFTSLSTGANIHKLSCNNNHTPVLKDGENIENYEILKRFPVKKYD